MICRPMDVGWCWSVLFCVITIDTRIKADVRDEQGTSFYFILSLSILISFILVLRPSSFVLRLLLFLVGWLNSQLVNLLVGQSAGLLDGQ